METSNTYSFDRDLCTICTKLDTISQTNQQMLEQIHLDEVSKSYRKHEEYIQRQHAAFTEMEEHVRNDPERSQVHAGNFQRVFEGNKSDLGLDALYKGVTGRGLVFSRPILDVYFQHCGGKRGVMEARCSHLIHLFQIGLLALMTYTTVTEDDEDQVKEKWAGRLAGIQAKMEDMLRRCN
ncbi:rapunzel 2 [Lampris incognitus]|uniref:rapunzel 2 n=1 Tax=Lampris incognitus TaxID=2546036 RepID=UPI0024B610BB|nr:rapunzel 2 [Lampris incognitus]XP_056141823.1 rapunzel 2 [Lampris incognitus]